MKCIVCGRSEHMSLSTWFVPTTHKGISITFVTCGDCLPGDAGLDYLPEGQYDGVQLHVVNLASN